MTNSKNVIISQNNAVINYIENKSNFRISDRAAKISFVVYMFFIFFGTSMPFQNPQKNIDEIGTSNIINQFVFSALFLTSMFSLRSKANELITLFKAEKVLILFIGWCGLTVLWSDFPFVSFKRLFQTLTGVMVCTSFLLRTSTIDEMLLYLKPLLYVYVISSLLSIFFIPGAVDENGLWRGFAKSKNHLGQASLISIIIWYGCLQSLTSRYKLIYLLMIGLSMLLLAGSRSMTAIFSALVVFLSTIVLKANNHFGHHGLKNIFVTYCVLVSIVTVASFYFVYPSFTASILHNLGKDITFTGRIDIWGEIFKEVRNHLIKGTGYAGFWVINNPKLIPIFNKFIWIPRQAHSGYLDILNETGAVGLVLLFFIIIRYYMIFFSNHQHWTQYFVVSVIVINIQESTFFRTNILTGVFFILAYLSLNVQKELIDNIDQNE